MMEKSGDETVCEAGPFWREPRAAVRGESWAPARAAEAPIGVAKLIEAKTQMADQKATAARERKRPPDKLSELSVVTVTAGARKFDGV
jgi:hypothetical protein